MEDLALLLLYRPTHAQGNCNIVFLFLKMQIFKTSIEKNKIIIKLDVIILCVITKIEYVANL